MPSQLKNLRDALLAPHLELYKALLLSKAIVSMPGIGPGYALDTASQSLDELATQKHPLTTKLSELLATANHGEQYIVELSPGLDLEISKVDSGIYDATVTCSDPNLGNYGDKILTLTKVTLESLIQALKAKELISNVELETSTPESLLSTPAAPKTDVSSLADLNTALRGFKGDLHIHIEKSEKGQQIELFEALTKPRL